MEIGKANEDVIANNCCNNGVDSDGKTRGKWNYQYNCATTIEGTGKDLGKAAENMAKWLGGFLKGIMPYLPYIIVFFVSMFAIPMLINIFKK